DIQARSAAWKADGMCSTKAGSRPENMRKNHPRSPYPPQTPRFLPYLLTDDQTRVILSLLQEEGHSDYINGNFIRGVDGSLAYIATQGPLPHTLLDFWRLVWEFGVKVILMACREIENGRVGVLCPQVSCPHGLWSGPDQARSDSLVSAGCGRTGVLCTVDYVRQLLLTQMIPPDFSLFDVVLEMRKQRPAAVQTEEQYRFLYHTVAQMFCSTLQNASLHYQNIKENCAPLHHDDALFLRTPQALLAMPRPPGGVLRSISVPGSPGHAMADTYAVVQKRGAPAGATLGCAPSPARRPRPSSSGLGGSIPARVPADQSPAASGAYEDVAGGAQTGGLGFNLRIGRPKGPRDPPAEWTRV
uniref:protein-tyrosine-phosphatase n=1 Tax=Colobus angolensis palliatus TaxID=336983 RepID=A0A2K5INH8_COLAP